MTCFSSRSIPPLNNNGYYLVILLFSNDYQWDSIAGAPTRPESALPRQRQAADQPLQAADQPLQGIDGPLLPLMYIMDRVECRHGKALQWQRGQCISAVYIVGSVGGGGCDACYQCQNILTIAGGHSPSRKSPPTKVLPLHIIEIPTKQLIPTL